MPKQTDPLLQGAQQILNASRKKLAQELPDLLPVIYLMRDEPCDQPLPLWTDGWTIFFHPSRVVQDYLERKNAVAEQLLHILAHGLLGHFPKRRGQAKRLFDAAADIKASSFIQRLASSYVHLRGCPMATKKMLKAQSGCSLEQLYLASESTGDATAVIAAGTPLEMDTHSFWGKPQSKNGKGQNGSKGNGFQSLWDAAAQQVASNLNAHDNGDLAGDFTEVYHDITASSVSYADFLRRFFALQERVEIDPDSINRIWYHVGLELTGDIPFIEAEELREDAPVLSLAVALDTSGSCQGPIMKRFLQELLSILRDSGGPKAEITLIQCDAEIQHISTLTREDCVEQIMTDFQTYGCGGTDFRPVFDYVTQSRNDAENRKPFNGLLYLSDGMGDFPDEAPDYPVAFLLPPDDWDEDCRHWIPRWVQTVQITSDGRLTIQDGETASRRNH